MAKVVHQRSTKSTFPMTKQWQECAGSYCETQEEAEVQVQWWVDYDTFYSLAGWEYKIVDVKPRKQS